MDWVDKLNQRALKGIRRNAVEKINTSGEGISLVRAGGSQLIGWDDLQEIAVVRQPHFASGSFALAIRSGRSALAIVDDSVLGFGQLCEELPRRLTDVTPYEKWSTELIADEDSEIGRVIFRRHSDV